jgi:hypothetical protein
MVGRVEQADYSGIFPSYWKSRRILGECVDSTKQDQQDSTIGLVQCLSVGSVASGRTCRHEVHGKHHYVQRINTYHTVGYRVIGVGHDRPTAASPTPSMSLRSRK